MIDTAGDVELLRRAHALYGSGGGVGLGGVSDVRVLADRLMTLPADLPGAGVRSGSAERLRRLAANDEALMTVLRRVAASHEAGRSATRAVWDAGRSDGAPVLDSGLERDEFHRRAAGRLRDQHRHVSRSRSHARSLAAALRRLSYGRGRRGGRGRLAPLGGLTVHSSEREVAAAIIHEGIRRGYSPRRIMAILSTAMQESNLSPRAKGGGGAWHGIFQQDAGYAGRDDPNRNIAEFYNRLDAKGGRTSPNIFKTIFWLQQRPGEGSAEAAFAHGRQAYLTEIRSQLGRAERLYRELTAA